MVHAVRKCEGGELQRMAATLAAAFQTDPVFSWLIPDEARRRVILPPSFKLLLSRILIDHEETYVEDGVGGVCAWQPPGTWRMSLREQLALLPSLGRVWGRSAGRGLRSVVTLERNHPREEHFYLVFLGVEPPSQGRGMGSALMFPVLRRCDQEGMPAYLEASSPRNRALYERHGFEVAEELRFSRKAPPLWRMWRDPA